MAKTPDSELYLVASGRANCGKTSSQVSESSNAANLNMRGQKIASGLLAFVEQELGQVFINELILVSDWKTRIPQGGWRRGSTNLQVKERCEARCFVPGCMP